jgi:lysozyme family protein
MAAATYDQALKRVLAHEGGYVNHPSDPGGETNYGITVAVARANGYTGPMRQIPMSAVKSIYRRKYWDVMRCDQLPAGVDYVAFDYTVNSGAGRVPKVLERLTAQPVDGRMDDALVKAIAAREPGKMVDAICDERLRFLQALKTWPTFGKGWARRVKETRSAGLAMAAAPVVTTTAPTPAPAQEPVAPAPGKGEVPVNGAAQKGTTGGAVATGGAVTQQAAEAGADATTIIIILILTAALAVGAWLFWRWRQKRAQETPAPGTVAVPVSP